VNRLTPFELAFAGEIAQRFAEIQSEAAAARKDASDLAQFVTLRSVQHIIAEIESPELLADYPEAANEYHLLVYAAYQFWSAGAHVLRLSDEAIAEHTSDLLPQSVTWDVPAGACYLQMPEHRFWAQVEATAPHEPLDGLFAVQSDSGRQLTVVAVLGLRPERRGFSQISAAVTRDEVSAISAAVRSPPFAPVMDGGVEAGFKSVTSVGELILLAHLALAHAER